MTVEVASAQAAVPTPDKVWHYRWEVTFIWQYKECSPTGLAMTSHLTITDPDELVEVIRRTSYDPRLQSFYYERREALDMSAAPRTCPSCGETYDSSAHIWWENNCACGGHMHYRCLACGQDQVYPQMAASCS